MRIYNPFKKEEYASSFTIKNENEYITAESNLKVEKVYIHNEELDEYKKSSSEINECIFVVKDEIIGKKIYDIIKRLKKQDVVIKTQDASFKISKIVSNFKHDQILAFYVVYKSKKLYRKFRELLKKPSNNYKVYSFYGALQADMEEKWKFKHISILEKIKEVLSFIGSLHNAGYYFSSDDFDVTICDSICGILSNMHEGGDVEDSKRCVIKLIHYILYSKMDIEYPDIKKRKYIDSTDVKYPISIFLMLYDYYYNNKVPNVIMDVIDKAIEEKESNLKYYKFKRYISLTNTLEKDIKNLIIEENKPSKVKILKLNHIDDMTTKYLLNNQKIVGDMIGIEIKNYIFNLDQKIIGIVYSDIQNLIKNNKTITINLNNHNFSSQYDLIEYGMKSLYNFIFRKVLEKNTILNNAEYKNINLEDYILVTSDMYFYFKNINKMIEFLKLSTDSIKKAYTSLFIKKYLEYIEGKYGKISCKSRFFELDEVKALSPELAVLFVNEAINDADPDFKNTSIKKFSIFDDFFTNIKYHTSYSGNYVYYGKYNFNPFEVKIVFQSELKDKYNISKLENKYTLIKDNRCIEKIKEMDVNKLLDIENENEKLIEKHFTRLYSSYKVEINKISEVICSSEELVNGMYKCIGFIRKK